MNARFKQSFSFVAGSYLDGSLGMYEYQLVIHAAAIEDDPEVNSIALERIRTFIDLMSSTIFIHQEDVDACKRLIELGVSVTTLPEDPVDQLIGQMFYSKLNAIVESRLLIFATEITSLQEPGLVFSHTEDDSLEIFESDGWWKRSNLDHADISINGEGNVVWVSSSNDWRELELDWPAYGDEEELQENNVVFAHFPNNENK